MKRIILASLLTLTTSLTLQADDLPELVFKNYTISDDSNKDVHALVKEGSQLVFPEPRKARVVLVKALTEVSKGSKIDKYDYLWTQYGLLKSSMESGGNSFGPGTKEDYEKVAEHVLKFLAPSFSTGFAPFTEEGAFEMEVCREAGNGLAWNLMEDGKKLEDALNYVDKAISCMRDEDKFIYDTKVRILLKMNKQDEAYKIVKEVLKDNPDFGDFQDLKEDEKYLAWLKSSK